MEIDDILVKVNRMKKQNRLKLVEEILKKINQEDAKKKDKKSIFDFQGSLSNEDAQIMKEAILDSRKVDKYQW